MKRLLCILLLTVFLLSGCQNQSGYDAPVKFYYQRAQVSYFTDNGVIDYEIHEAQGYSTDYKYLLSLYLAGPEQPELKQIFPDNVTLVALELTENTAIVTLSDEIVRLTGLDLTIASACLSATVCEMTGVTSVTIRAANLLIDGNKSITMNRNHILLLDSSTAGIGN